MFGHKIQFLPEGRMIPEIQKVNYVNHDFSAGVLQLALPDANGKDDLVH